MAYEKAESKDKADDILAAAKKCFEACQSNEDENRNAFKADIRFALLGEQWDEKMKKKRADEGRPALTVNKLPAFIRQVVNDARQNRPQTKVRPVDGGADKHTAEVFNGLIRNIETTSQADVCYDTAAQFSVSGGFGYWTFDIDFAHDDTFDKDIKFRRIDDPLTIYGDPLSTAADSADWMEAFEVATISAEKFQKLYPNKDLTSWDSETPSTDAEKVKIAYYWKREEVDKELLRMSDGQVIPAEKMTEEVANGWTHADILEISGVKVVERRKTKSFEVTRYVLSGADLLETTKWAGKYIPIVPVYGDEINVEGTRYLYSLIRHAKEAQQRYNYQVSAETEMIALEPKAPWIGAKGSFDTDPNWDTANTQNHSKLEYDIVAGSQPPQRTPVNMAAGAAAMQAARVANDDMKAVMGIYDASLGQKSNETSGKAIMARQREGDVSTFHFIDNLSRAVRHSGRILIDLIPKVYTPGRIVRVLGVDGSVAEAKLGEQPQAPSPPKDGATQFDGVYNLTAGKYDLAVEAGPSFTTRRQEAATEMTEFVRAFPEAAPIMGDIIVKAMDWPQADEMAERIKSARESAGQNNPEAQKMQLEAEKLKMQAAHDQQKAQADLAIEQQKMQLEREKAQQEILIEREKAEAQIEIERMKAGVQMELQSQKTQGDIDTQRNKAAFDADLKAKGQEQKSSAAVKVNLPDALGPAIAESISQVMQSIPSMLKEGMREAFQNMPPLQVKMPRMKRTPVRDRHGMIEHSIDEPIEETLQ